jgi:DNA-binding PadR family transcriptional regulator
MGHREKHLGGHGHEFGGHEFHHGPGFGAGFGPGRRGRGFGPPPWVREMFGPGRPGGPGFGPGFGPGAGRGPRVRRGDVRAAILDVVAAAERAEAPPLNGYQVIQQIAERTTGAWKPSPGSVYPTIQQLEDEGLLVTTDGEGRKVLRLTPAGQAYVAEHPDELAAVWAPFAEENPDDGGDYRRVIPQLMAAVWQIASHGSPAQHAAAASVLAETRRKLYTILAEDDPA